MTDAELAEEGSQRIYVPAFLQLNIPTSWNETRILEYLQDIRLSGTSDSDIRIMAVSHDDLNMYTKIGRTVLRNVDLLKKEINTILSGMLSEVAIDTTQRAEMCVNLTIPGNNSAENIIEHVEDITQPSTIRTAVDNEKMKTMFDRMLRELRQKLKIKEEGRNSNFSEEQPSITNQINEQNSENSENVVEKAVNLSAINNCKPRTKAEFVEESSEMNSEDGLEKAENRSAVHDDKTRTTAECVDNSEINSEDVVEKAHNSSAVHGDKERTKAEFVDITPTEKTNYFKLVALLVDTACHVIWTYIRETLLGSSSFESFLNLIKEKHKLIHVYETNECCECVSEMIKGEQLISRKQLLLLYKSDESKQIQNHTIYVGRKVVQVCICKYIAIKNIDVKIIDITLANYIILKCGKQELGLDNWMTQIKEVRNEIFHISDIQEITDDKFRRKWEKVKGSILGIAKLINRTFVERAQIENFHNKAEALHIQYPKVCSKSLERDYQKTMAEIRNLNTLVDNINILIKVFGNEQDMNTLKDTESMKKDCQSVHVPVFMQLDLPASWNRTKVLEYLDEIRLNRTSDMNIRIMAVSPDDLNVYSEIARTVLRKVDLLKDEVKIILSGMLEEASVDRKQIAKVVVSLTIPDITVPFKSSFEFDVQLRQKFELQSIRDFGNRDCIITNDQLVFTDYVRNQLLIYNFNGSYIRNIRLSCKPLIISVTNRNNIAVSFLRESIKIISIKTGKVKNIIETRGINGGISYQNGLMYVVNDYEKIDVIYPTGEIIRSFNCPLESTVQCLSADTDRLFLTYPLINTVYCCDLNGSDKWKFTDDKMIMPSGVTTDGNGNVYVVCHKSNNVVVVSPDGKHHKEILTKKDGLRNPSAINYNKSNDCLLVCNGGNCDALLFDVKHSTKNE
ncbi:unnamed protein product [Mytilus coruscus]|uniref:DZIP3-like HEPN domain-containing protein n=1 Tax=Mytilus coruscus TaxID=42192 RepID=A0A6J8CDL9_MYTCO|nr:unnamed protein product [Mytilus coruscus]